MSLVYGPIPKSGVLDTEREGWTPLRQDKINTYVALSLILAAPFCVAAYVDLDHIKPMIRSNPIMLTLLMVSLLLMLPVHELLHVVVFRGWWKDQRIMMGIWPSKGMWVCYDCPQPRNRLLVMSLTPLFALSLIPLGVLTLLPVGPWTLFLNFISLLHVAACTGDIQTFSRVIRQVQKNAVIHNKGWQTYWLLPGRQ